MLPLNPEALNEEAVTDFIAAIYQQALKDYEWAFLKLKKLEKEEGKEAEKERFRSMKEEAEDFMLTGGDYNFDHHIVERIARCFEAFQNIIENL